MCDRSSKHRHAACVRQAGLCYYCALPMWEDTPDAFAERYKLTLQQALQFKCTAEHLKARKDGGRNARKNIVAACLFCNQERHRRDDAHSPAEHREEIQRRMGGNSG